MPGSLAALRPAELARTGARPGSTVRSASCCKPLSTTSAAGGSAKNFSKPCSSSRCDLTISSAAIERYVSLARFLEALIDSSANLLVVVAGIQASLLQWRGSKVIQDSAWDRLAQFEIPLQRIRVDEGRAIVRRSFDVAVYQPRQPDEWQEPYRRFLGMIG